MPSKRRNFGDICEEIVCRYLVDKGHEIIARNFLRPFGEIDIVSKYRLKNYFIEVKGKNISVSRETDGQIEEIHEIKEISTYESYLLEENVHSRKKIRLRRAISAYMYENRINYEDVIVSVAAVLVDFNEKKALIRFTENITL